MTPEPASSQGGPSGPKPPGQMYVPPRRSVWSVVLGVCGIAALAAIYWVFLHEPRELVEPTPNELAGEGPPTILLRPSLVVNGPAPVPYPVKSGHEAHPDEVIIFRVNVRGEGYVMIAIEGPGGALARVYGGHPDDEPISGSQLLYDSNQGGVLAVALEAHRGTTLKFVAALSSTPWDPFPEKWPLSPRVFPDPAQPDAEPPAENVLAWDRFFVRVARSVPASRR